jgi:uncharacterized protein (TIGR02996 family)
VDTEHALLQALHADPTDTVTWSALADCLEEQGQSERAELLRLSRLPQPGKAARSGAAERVRELLAAGVIPCVPTLENSIGMRFALIPPGTFLMGSPTKEKVRNEDEGPQHEVQISRHFYLGVVPVTQTQYQQVTRGKPSYFRPGGGGKEQVQGLDTADFPVENVSWEDALAFCQKLSEKAEEKRERRVYILPSEAQWEYGCRGGAPSSNPFHYGPSLCSTQANFDGNYPSGGGAEGPYLERPTPVGSYQPNAFGLYDMHGNVWEWCQDWYAEDYYAGSPGKDPPGPATGEHRVLRGGSWDDFAGYCRSACRGRLEPGVRDFNVGFRVACLLP